MFDPEIESKHSLSRSSQNKHCLQTTPHRRSIGRAVAEEGALRAPRGGKGGRGGGAENGDQCLPSPYSILNFSHRLRRLCQLYTQTRQGAVWARELLQLLRDHLQARTFCSTENLQARIFQLCLESPIQAK